VPKDEASRRWARLRHAFPRARAALDPAHPNLIDLAGRVSRLPRVARNLKSKRRIPFNQSGIRRYYPELDR